MLLISKIFIFNIHKQDDAAIQHKFTYSDDFDRVISDKLEKSYLCLRISEDIIKLKDQYKYNFFIAGKKRFYSQLYKLFKRFKFIETSKQSFITFSYES